MVQALTSCILLTIRKAGTSGGGSDSDKLCLVNSQSIYSTRTELVNCMLLPPESHLLFVNLVHICSYLDSYSYTLLYLSLWLLIFKVSLTSIKNKLHWSLQFPQGWLNNLTLICEIKLLTVVCDAQRQQSNSNWKRRKLKKADKYPKQRMLWQSPLVDIAVMMGAKSQRTTLVSFKSDHDHLLSLTMWFIIATMMVELPQP